jgi:hypothetical protein
VAGTLMVCGLENVVALWGGSHCASEKQKKTIIEERSIYLLQQKTKKGKSGKEGKCTYARIELIPIQ